MRLARTASPLLRYSLVDEVGFEPTMPEAADLQSAGVTNFPTHPYFLVGLERLELSRLSAAASKTASATNYDTIPFFLLPPL